MKMSENAISLVLKPEDHEFFLKHGFVILKNAVSKSNIDEAVEALETGSFQGSPGTGAYKPIRHPSVDACLTPMILDAIGEIFGAAYPYERGQQGVDMPRLYEPGATWKMQGIHVDDDYPTAMPAAWALGMFIFLTPVQSHGGAFLYVDHSPYRYRASATDQTEWLNFLEGQDELKGVAKEFLAEPGDVLLFHHLTGHAGSNNVSDPQTRHALLSRWHPQHRIVPGSKPFDEMTTIEKANSVRYIRERNGEIFQTIDWIDNKETNELLLNGFSGKSSIVAHTIFRDKGITHILYTDLSEPTLIRKKHSLNGVDWTESNPIQIRNKVGVLHFFRKGVNAQLFVGIGGESPETSVFGSQNLTDWSLMETISEIKCAAGHYSSDFGSQIGKGNFIIFPSASDDSVILSRSVTTTMKSEHITPIYKAPMEFIISDVFVKPTLGESEFALILDVQNGGASSAIQPYYTLSNENLSYNRTAQPIAFPMPTPPRQIRIYARARRYWLVTYLRQVIGQERIFWGIIDWEHNPVELIEIVTLQALKQAFYVVGLQ